MVSSRRNRSQYACAARRCARFARIGAKENSEGPARGIGGNGRLIEPVDAPDGGREWYWVMSVFRPATLEWRSKCMEPKVLTRLGTLSGSVAPGHWQSLPGAVAGLGRIDVGGRSWIVGRWRQRPCAIDEQKKQPYSSNWIEPTATADRAVRRCVARSSTTPPHQPTRSMSRAATTCARTRLPPSHGAFRHCRSHHALSAPAARPPAVSPFHRHANRSKSCVIAPLPPPAPTISSAQASDRPHWRDTTERLHHSALANSPIGIGDAGSVVLASGDDAGPRR